MRTGPRQWLVGMLALLIALQPALVWAQDAAPDAVNDPTKGLSSGDQGPNTASDQPHVFLPPGTQPPDQSGDGSQGGTLQQRIVSVANAIVGKPFDYAPGTEGGVLGCAQVVSTVLKEAGAIPRVVLNVMGVVNQLHDANWSDVSPPPWHDGDVITWATYSPAGHSTPDPDTHIGIIQVEGGTVWAINNSSSALHPIKIELSAMPYRISRVVRQNG